MGQTQLPSCMHPEQDTFLHEIRVYRWRADPDVNACLPRVYFRSAFAQLQEEQFTQFLEQQKDKQYFQISKFKEELERVPNTGDDQVIVFQRYYCSLDQLTRKMTLQQSLYAEIKKVYQTITVDGSCCFITTEGSIRAWINPNVKINRVWKQHDGVAARHLIIQRIVKMAQQYTELSKRSADLFSTILYNIANHLKNCSFGELRRWINEYCYISNIKIPNRISLTQKNHEITRVRENKQYQRNTMKTQTSQRPEECKQNNVLFLSTQQSSFNRAFTKVRSLQKNMGTIPVVYQARNIKLSSSPMRPIINHCNFQLQQTTSQLFPATKAEHQPIKYSAVIQRSTPYHMPNQSHFIAKQGHQKLQNYRSTSPLYNNSKDVNCNQQTKSPSSKKISEKAISAALSIRSISNEAHKIRKPKQQVNNKKPLQASIMQNIVENNQVRKQNRYRTAIDKQLSQKQSNSNSDCYSRRWITTKTITRLISDNDDKYSIKNSIGQSSDYYNGSAYSGVLTQMGRAVSKPINEGRSKTLGVSQQI